MYVFHEEGAARPLKRAHPPPSHGKGSVTAAVKYPRIAGIKLSGTELARLEITRPGESLPGAYKDSSMPCLSGQEEEPRDREEDDLSDRLKKNTFKAAFTWCQMRATIGRKRTREEKSSLRASVSLW